MVTPMLHGSPLKKRAPARGKKEMGRNVADGIVGDPLRASDEV